MLSSGFLPAKSLREVYGVYHAREYPDSRGSKIRKERKVRVENVRLTMYESVMYVYVHRSEYVRESVYKNKRYVRRGGGGLSFKTMQVLRWVAPHLCLNNQYATICQAR